MYPEEFIVGLHMSPVLLRKDLVKSGSKELIPCFMVSLEYLFLIQRACYKVLGCACAHACSMCVRSLCVVCGVCVFLYMSLLLQNSNHELILLHLTPL
jgi:hypothetical protein